MQHSSEILPCTSYAGDFSYLIRSVNSPQVYRMLMLACKKGAERNFHEILSSISVDFHDSGAVHVRVHKKIAD